MQQRKVQDEDDARTALAAVARSGLSRRAWARQHGIDPRSLNAWQINLARRKQRTEGSPLHLVEVTPVHRSSSSAVYAIVMEGLRIEVGDDFEEDTLRRLFGVLRSC